MSITSLAVITLVTVVFAIGFNETLFRNLSYFEVKYEKTTKTRIFWLIFYFLFSLTIYFYLMFLIISTNFGHLNHDNV